MVRNRLGFCTAYMCHCLSWPWCLKSLQSIKHCLKSLLFSNNEAWKKDQTESCFDATMGSLDGTEVCKLVRISILRKLINKKDCCLYIDDELLILWNVNGQQIDRMRNIIIKIFEDIGFTIDIEANLKTILFRHHVQLKQWHI